MYRKTYHFIIFALFALVWLAVPSISAAQSYTGQYCYRDADNEPHPNTFDVEYYKQLVECNMAPDIKDQAFNISSETEILDMNCNPALAGDCEDKNITYENFEIDVEYKGEKFSITPTYAGNTDEQRVSGGFVKIVFQKQGSKACLYLEGTFNSGLLNELVHTRMHCVKLPPPQTNYTAPQWSNMIADVCLDYTKGHSQYRFLPVTGVVVECVEETMRNIFALKKSGEQVDSVTAPLFAMNDPRDYDRTFFGQVQENLRGMVLAVLVLYVTIFGLNVVMSQKIPSKGDFIMAVVKFALVLYFTLGTGIVDFVPRLIDMSKTLSLILMESSENLPIKYQYCDFSNETYAPGYDTMELWDIVDCKLSKYLGFREGGKGKAYKEQHDFDQMINDNAPKVILIAIIFWGGSVFGSGIVVLIFALATAVFMITLIIRVAHVYMIAMMAIYFLAFLAPLIIPTVLFNYTKDLFDNWLKQMISFALQPVILFAFLALLFAVSDFVMFRGNNEFCQDDSIRMVNQQLNDDGTCTHIESETEWKCAGDDSAPACVIMKHINLKLKAGLFPYWEEHGASIGDVLMAFMMLFFVFFILNSMIPTIEELSHRLTDSSGGGAVQMAGSKVIGPASSGTYMASGAASLATAAAVGGFNAGKGGAQVADRKLGVSGKASSAKSYMAGKMGLGGKKEE